MALQTRALLKLNIITTTTSPDRVKLVQVNEDMLNEVLVVRNCFNCDYSAWNKDKTAVNCTKFNATPPLWAIACGCEEFDYIPF